MSSNFGYINNCYFHPSLDDQCLPILDDVNNCYFDPNLDDQCHPILDVINNCYFHPNLDDQCHPILDDACHPKLDGQFHPFLYVYYVILSLNIEKSIKKHPFLDEFGAISQIFQKWMIVGRQSFLEAEPTSLPQLQSRRVCTLYYVDKHGDISDKKGDSLVTSIQVVSPL